MVIATKALSKTFTTKIKEPGLKGSVQAIFRPAAVDVRAVKGIDLYVERGEVVAFIGPNGAGKSTTIKMLTGILHPTSGEATVLGLTPWKDRERLSYKVGSVFGQKSQLWYHLPPIDTFNLLGKIYEMDQSEQAKRRDFLVEAFEIGDLVKIPVRKLSLGQRMRCEIAAFWVEDTWAFRFLYTRIVMIFGGMMLPLDILPDAIRQVARALPTSLIVYGPVRTFLSFSLGEWVILVGKQVVWLTVVAFTATLIFQTGVKQINVHGG